MKLNKTLYFIFLSTFLTTSVIAQTTKKDTFKIKDTANVDLRGKQIAKAMVLLRDSINQTLSAVSKGQSNANGEAKVRLSKSAHSLALYKDRLELDIKEVFNQTSSNGWKPEMVKRIKDDTDEVRRGYKNILRDVKQQLASR